MTRDHALGRRKLAGKVNCPFLTCSCPAPSPAASNAQVLNSTVVWQRNSNTSCSSACSLAYLIGAKWVTATSGKGNF